MKIIGWIRYGDKTACGGTVVEGLPNCTSHGRAISFQGARIACRKGCVIVEGFPRATLPNGRPRVIHGMVTSGGCPCYSTLNDIDGVGNESGEACRKLLSSAKMANGCLCTHLSSTRIATTTNTSFLRIKTESH